MNRLPLALLFALVPAIALAQKPRSPEDAQRLALLARLSAERQELQKEAEWKGATKITLLKSHLAPDSPPKTQSKEPSKLETGWEGELSSWEFKVLSISNENEMLLKCGDDVLWLVDYPTKNFKIDQTVRVFGPVKAGKTKNYEVTAGNSRMVRAIRLMDGVALTKFEKQLEIERIARARYLDVRLALQLVIWGKDMPLFPEAMEPEPLARYKNELESVKRLIDEAKVNKSHQNPLVYDSEQKRIEFNSEDARTTARDHLKSLFAEIPK